MNKSTVDYYRNESKKILESMKMLMDSMISAMESEQTEDIKMNFDTVKEFLISTGIFTDEELENEKKFIWNILSAKMTISELQSILNDIFIHGVRSGSIRNKYAVLNKIINDRKKGNSSK